MICSYLPRLGFQSCLRIDPPKDVTLPPERDLLPRLREMRLRHTAQSEGYETMTQYSSDIVSEVKHTYFGISLKVLKTILLSGSERFSYRKKRNLKSL